MKRLLIAASMMIAASAPVFAQNTLTSSTAPTVNVKDYGAIGDGVTDDYAAIQAAVKAVNANRGGTLYFPPGTYRINRYRILGGAYANGSTVSNIEFRNCNGLFVVGYGAKLDFKGDFYRSLDYYSGSYGCSYENSIQLLFTSCTNFTVKGLELDGNVDVMTRDASVIEGPSHGIATSVCSNYTFKNLYTHHFAADGVYLGSSGTTADRYALLQDITSTHNARDGISVIQLRNATFNRCRFDSNGLQVGTYLPHAPYSGVNIEANHGTPTVNVNTGALTFNNCVVTNSGHSEIQSSGLTKDTITFQGCTILKGSANYINTINLAVPGGVLDGCTMDVRQIVPSWSGVTGTSTTIRNCKITSDYRAITDYVSAAGAVVNITNNQITGTMTAPTGTYFPMLHNPSTIFQGNTVTIPAAAKSTATATPAALLQLLQLSSGNTFKTNYVPVGSAHFYNDYTGTASVSSDYYVSGTAYRPAANSTFNTALPYSK